MAFHSLVPAELNYFYLPHAVSLTFFHMAVGVDSVEKQMGICLRLRLWKE